MRVVLASQIGNQSGILISKSLCPTGILANHSRHVNFAIYGERPKHCYEMILKAHVLGCGERYLMGGDSSQLDHVSDYHLSWLHTWTSMASLNDPMIHEVFASLVEHRPQLKTLQELSDEEGDDLTVDTRFVADLIIRAFPWPIGVELRRLFSAQLIQPDRMRLDQLFKTFERTLQFLCFTLAAQLLDLAGKRTVTIKPNIAAEFQRRWTTVTLGNMAWAISEIQKILQDNGQELFMPEMNAAIDSDFVKTCQIVVPERNEIGHYMITLTEEEIQIRCVELQDRLMKILKDLGFLAKYKLVSVRSINVEKQRRTNAHYTHLIHLLNSSNSDFKAQELNETEFSESKSVLLLRTTKTITDYLNLSPFIIDTGVETINTKEKMGIKKDIFLYSTFRNDVLQYIGTEATAKHDLRALSNYANLVADMKDFMRIFN